MPRQRKPQNGGQRLWTWRVANTTTGSTTTQAVYRIPTGKKYGECDVRNFEVTGTSPIVVAIEWENVYRISLDMAALESAIEGMNLDLSNVTLQTVNGNIEFTGNITADWTFTWTTVTATTIEWTTGSFGNLSASTLTSETSTLWTATATSLETWSLSVSWTSTLTWNVTAGADLFVTWDTSTASISASTWSITSLTSTDIDTATLDASWAVTVGDGLTVTGGIASDAVETSWAAHIGWNFAVQWTSAFTGDVTTDNITSTWTATLNNVTTSWNATLANVTVNGASTLSGNASIWGNLSVTGNETVTGNVTVTGDGIFSNDVSVARNLNVSGDATITDDLTVNGTTHLKGLETDWSVDVDGTLRVTWAIDAGNWLSVDGQIESDSIVTTNTVTDNLTVNGNIALGNNATAPDFILQSEKGAANGVAPLDANGKVDASYLPPVYTTAIVKMGTWTFSNSNTSVVVDADITADSAVLISNYQDIVWDLDETISIGQITVVSNQTETWSYKYLIVNPISNS